MIRLGDLVTLQGGGTPSRSQPSFWNGDIPWASVKDLTSSRLTNTMEYISSAGVRASATNVVPSGSVVVATRMAVGRASILAIDAAINQDLKALIPRAHSKIHSPYLIHLLTASAGYLESRATGATVKGIRCEVLEELPVPHPVYRDQVRVANILDKADTIHRKRKEAVALTEELLRSAFLEMFGDPVTNPKRWRSSAFGYETELLEYGPRFYNERYSEDGVRIVRITDLDASGRLNFSTMPRLAVDEHERQRYVLRPGDVIFARTGATVGKTALIEPGDPEAIPGAYFIRLRFKPEVRPLFARQVLASEQVQQIIVSRSRQSAQQNFSGPGIRELPLPIPPLALQKRLEELANGRQALLEQYRRAEAESEVLFNSLLRQAFAGLLTPNGAPR